MLRWLAHSGNPVMNPHTEGRRKDTCHNDKSVEREEGTGKGKQLSKLTLKKTLTKNKTATMPLPQDYVEYWCMCISKCR